MTDLAQAMSGMRQTEDRTEEPARAKTLASRRFFVFRGLLSRRAEIVLAHRRQRRPSAALGGRRPRWLDQSGLPPGAERRHRGDVAG